MKKFLKAYKTICRLVVACVLLLSVPDYVSFGVIRDAEIRDLADAPAIETINRSNCRSQTKTMPKGDLPSPYSEDLYRKLSDDSAGELPEDWENRLEAMLSDDAGADNLAVEKDEDDASWTPPDAIDSGKYNTAVSSVCTQPSTLAAIHAAQARSGYPCSMTRRDSGQAYDCSSLLYWCYLDAGVNIDPVGCHTAASIAEYLIGSGREIQEGDLLPGDLIFYSYEQNGRYRNISHMAMVLGDGEMIHASSTAGKVTTKRISLYKAVAIARPVVVEEPSTPSDAAPELPDETVSLESQISIQMGSEIEKSYCNATNSDADKRS